MWGTGVSVFPLPRPLDSLAADVPHAAGGVIDETPAVGLERQLLAVQFGQEQACCADLPARADYSLVQGRPGAGLEQRHQVHAAHVVVDHQLGFEDGERESGVGLSDFNGQDAFLGLQAVVQLAVVQEGRLVDPVVADVGVGAVAPEVAGRSWTAPCRRGRWT